MRRILAVIGIVIVLVPIGLLTVMRYPSLIAYRRVGITMVPIRCADPPPHAVRTEREAIVAARTALFCLNLDYWPQTEAGRQAWLNAFAAYKSKGLLPLIADQNAYGRNYLWIRALVRFPDVRNEEIWHVVQKPPPPGYVGPALFVEIAARDGRLVDFTMTQ